MTIDPFLQGGHSINGQFAKNSLAFESVYNGLGVRDDDEANRRLVAEKIIELAGHGMQGATLRARAEARAKLKLLELWSCRPPACSIDERRTLVICPACGADLGRWGDVKES
jgi:hypothetical protein